MTKIATATAKMTMAAVAARMIEMLWKGEEAMPSESDDEEDEDEKSPI